MHISNTYWVLSYKTSHFILIHVTNAYAFFEAFKIKWPLGYKAKARCQDNLIPVTLFWNISEISLYLSFHSYNLKGNSRCSQRSLPLGWGEGWEGMYNL